jgi:hypothetical protein
MEISDETVTVLSGPGDAVRFDLPADAFGNPQTMAKAIKGYVTNQCKPRRTTVRIYVNSRQTVLRNLADPFPFDESSHVINTDTHLGLTIGIPLQLVDALIDMCLAIGFDLHDIEQVSTVEHALLMRYSLTPNPLCLILPQGSGCRLMLISGGVLTGVYFISGDVDYRETELNRIWIWHAPPERVLLFPGAAFSWIHDYFSMRSITVSEESYSLW